MKTLINASLKIAASVACGAVIGAVVAFGLWFAIGSSPLVPVAFAVACFATTAKLL